MSYFLRDLMALSMMASKLLCRTPVIIWARRHRNFYFTLLKQNSIGFQSGLKATQYTKRNFKSCIVFLLFFEQFVDRLSMKMQILSSPFSARSRLRYSWNFGMFTDFGNCMYSSWPFSREMPDSTAVVGALTQLLSIVTF